MKRLIQLVVLMAGWSGLTCAAEELFRDDFKGRLQDGWSWVREDKAGWRVTEPGLEIRVQPGNLWGPENNATNVLTRVVSAVTNTTLQISVTIENRPTEQYEQANLAWYYDDSHMVKLGQELVDGKLSIVMGREEKDRARTIAIIPIEPGTVHVRFTVTGNLIRGEFRIGDESNWRLAGECDLPINGVPKISLHTYQGPKMQERWARFSKFSIQRIER